MIEVFLRFINWEEEAMQDPILKQAGSGRRLEVHVLPNLQ